MGRGKTTSLDIVSIFYVINDNINNWINTLIHVVYYCCNSCCGKMVLLCYQGKITSRQKQCFSVRRKSQLPVGAAVAVLLHTGFLSSSLPFPPQPLSVCVGESIDWPNADAGSRLTEYQCLIHGGGVDWRGSLWFYWLQIRFLCFSKSPPCARC